jgi:hypothetical protein
MYEMSATQKAYLDNVIVSGIAQRDIEPSSEMEAIDRLQARAHAGTLRLITSRETQSIGSASTDSLGRSTDASALI